MTFRLDLHVHTDASPDGRSSLADQAAAAKAAGLDAIAVTDHNLCTPVPPELEGVLLIPGCEVSTTDGHIIGLFLDAPLDLEGLRSGGLPTGARAVEEIRRRGGLAVLAHPYQSAKAAPEGFPFRPDAVETANARAALKVREANQKAERLAIDWALPAVGGSDAHSRREVGSAYTQVECMERTLSALKAALLAGECRGVLVRDTAHIQKGLSQLAKAHRLGGGKRLAVALAYVACCAGRDLLRPFR
ncbi:MAG TPA: PHP domain-containing protein [Candidatus Galloscillospira excrementavium]|nr:PHP domain-containing protein [Candidatus Galloscillospira excrementavium]